MYETKNRKKGVAVALVGGLAATALIGGTFASVTTAYTIETDNEVTATVDMAFTKTANSEPIIKNITPGEAAETFTVEVQNTGSLQANYALMVANADELALPDVAKDNTPVTITSYYASTSWSYTTTLRGFLENATVSGWSQNGEKAIAPGEVRTFEITIGSVSEAAVWTPADFGDFTLEFDTVLVGSHVVSGTSDLLDYAVANGTVVNNSGGGLQVYTIPAADAVSASQG